MFSRLLLLSVSLFGQVPVPSPSSPPYNPQAEYAAALQARDAGREAQAQEILKAIIAHDLTFAPAWQALGYEKIGDVWVLVQTRGPTPSQANTGTTLPMGIEARGPAPSLTTASPTPLRTGDARTETLPASQPNKGVSKLIRQSVWKQIEIGYAQQISPIRRTMLAAGGEIFERGKQRLMTFRDPLAIHPLCEELSTDKDPRVRKLLVEWLDGVTGSGKDHATLNLIAVAVLDDSADVRRTAIQALANRTDGRIEQTLRSALPCSDEDLLTNAVFALGQLRARSAVPELVNVLQPGLKPGPLKPADWIKQAESWYAKNADATLPPAKIAYIWPPAYNPYRKPPATPSFRSTVQEALIAITGGKNFGFDREAWLQWNRETP